MAAQSSRNCPSTFALTITHGSATSECVMQFTRRQRARKSCVPSMQRHCPPLLPVPLRRLLRRLPLRRLPLRRLLRRRVPLRRVPLALPQTIQ